MQTSISKMATIVMVTNALFIAILPAMAAELNNRALSERIYGPDKATLLWPDDHEDRLFEGNPDTVKGPFLSAFEGVVSRVRSRDYFDFRTDEGRIYRVVGQDEKVRFDVAAHQRILVRGYLTQDILVAFNVQPVNQTGSSQVDFPGTVSSINGIARLTVRSDNGRSYTIDARNRLPYGISAGAYIRIIGQWDGISILASRIIILRYNSGSNISRDRYVDFPGSISEVDNLRRALKVRGENGITYVVNYAGNLHFGFGDRVQVTGYFDGYNVRANSVVPR